MGKKIEDRQMEKQQPTCVATLSGGIDSVVLVHWLKSKGETPLCVYVDYGTVSRDAELRCARQVCEDLGLELEVLPMPAYNQITKALLLGNTDIVDGGRMFWLEGRNSILAMLLAVKASFLGLSQVYMGMNYGDTVLHDDGTIAYPDTDARFVSALNTLIMCGFRSPPTIRAPWIELKMKKPDIIQMGETFGIDWKTRTHSCSRGLTEPCCDYWKCESCIGRYSDFEDAGLHDPFHTPIVPK